MRSGPRPKPPAGNSLAQRRPGGRHGASTQGQVVSTPNLAVRTCAQSTKAGRPVHVGSLVHDMRINPTPGEAGLKAALQQGGLGVVSLGENRLR